MTRTDPATAAPEWVCALLKDRDPVPLTGGRTNRLWRSGDRVAKLFVDGAETPLFPNSAETEWQALCALRDHALAPHPVLRSGNCVIYRYVEGQPGQSAPADVAQLLHKLHSVPPFDGLSHAATGQAIIAEGKAMLGGSGSDLLADIPPAPSEPKLLVPIHRDPVPNNIVHAPHRDTLIDWQCPALGDPVEDIAHYLSPAMHTLYGDGPLDSSARDQFLTAYPGKECVERYRTYGRAFHWRMAAYCEWQVARNRQDYAAALAHEKALLANWDATM